MSNQEKDDGRTNVGFNVPDNSNMDQASPNFSTSDVVRTFDGQLLLMTEKNQNSSQIVTPNSANISKAKYQVYSRVKRLCILAHKARLNFIKWYRHTINTEWRDYLLDYLEIDVRNGFFSWNRVQNLEIC